MSELKTFIIVQLLSTLSAALSYGSTGSEVAATSTNQFGVELHHRLATADENLCVSPYSIENALAMAFAGAAGETRAEMAQVLHFPNESDEMVASSFTELQHSLTELTTTTADLAKESKRFGGPSEPITLSVANRLFAQTGYDFRESFLGFVKKHFGAAFEPADFVGDSSGATSHINQWVAEQTRNRIRDLIPQGALNAMTRMVLTNAIYLKAPWASEFYEAGTQRQPFHVRGAAPVDVLMMQKRSDFGYARHDGYTAVSLPYSGGDLQFLVLLPDEINGLAALESKLTSEMLAACAKLPARDVDLSLPKFKMEPPSIALAATLEALGLKTAFDRPKGSANFDRMAPRRPNGYLYISEVFHKTFIAVDEKGTEAAAATAVAAMATSALRTPPPPPIEVKVDRPFLYAIQHVPSGLCLFLGHVVDPR